MARFLLRLEYVGSRYRGWQIQENARTIQGDIAEAVALVTGTNDFELYGSGRTDAGVHALLQVAHLDVDTTLPPEKLRQDLNDSLPPDINVLSLDRVARDFHARHGAIGRSYMYQIARRRTAFGKPFVWWVRDRLDIESMKKAAAVFVGFHDFRGFTAVDPDEVSTKVKIEVVDVVEAGDLILVRIRGSHFLWKMVRRLVGVIVEVGRGKLTPADAQTLLENPAGLPAELTAPPSGLYLEQVIYEGEEFDRPLVPAFAVPSVPPLRRQAPPPSWKVDEGASQGEGGAEAPRKRRPSGPPRRDDRTSRYVPGQKPRSPRPSDDQDERPRASARSEEGGRRGQSGASGTSGERSDERQRRPSTGEGYGQRTAGGGTYRKPSGGGYRKPTQDGAYRKPTGGGGDYHKPATGEGSYSKPSAEGSTYRKPGAGSGEYRKPYPKKRYDDAGEGAGGRGRREGSSGADAGRGRGDSSGSGYRRPPTGEGSYRKPSAEGSTYRKPSTGSGTYRRPPAEGGGDRKPYPKKRYGGGGERSAGASRGKGGSGRSAPPPHRRGGPRRSS